MEDLKVLTDGGGREHCLRTTQLAPEPVRYSLHQHRYRNLTATAVLWIRIRIDPHHFGNLNLHPDQHPHQIKIRIRINLISWVRNRIRIRINLQITSQNVWNMSLFLALFQGFGLYLEARIWIRIRINKNQNPDQHPDPHQGAIYKSNSKKQQDPHQTHKATTLCEGAHVQAN